MSLFVARRGWSLALAVCAVASVAPLFAARFLPFSDLPEHLAAISVIERWFGGDALTRDTYVIAWGKSQYLLYHFTAALLAKVIGSVEWANKCLLAVVGLSFPYAVRSLLRAFSRDERLALFACPLFFSHALLYGLLPFVASIPVAVAGLALTVRYAHTPTRFRFFALTILGVALFHLHVSAFLVFALGGAAIVAFGSSSVSLYMRIARIAWLGPSLVAALGWVAVSNVGTGHASIREPGQIVYRSARSLSRAFEVWSQNVWRSHVDESLAVAFWILVGLLALDSLRTRTTARAENAIGALRFVPLIVAVLLYLALPFRIGAADSLNVRMGIFLPLFLLLTFDVRPSRWTSAAFIGALFVGLGASANNAYEVRASAAETEGLETVLSSIPPGARVLTLDFSFREHPSRTHVPPWLHVGAYHVARNGGVAGPSFAVLGHWPIQFRPGAAPPSKADDFWEFAPCMFRNSQDGPYFDYALVRGSIDPFRNHPPGPAWHDVARGGEYILYGKRPGERIDGELASDRGPCVAGDAREAQR